MNRWKTRKMTACILYEGNISVMAVTVKPLKLLVNYYFARHSIVAKPAIIN